MRVHKEIPCLLLAAGFLCSASLLATTSSVQLLNEEFQTAVADYQSHHYAQARQILVGMLKQFPGDFDLNELMGMICRGQGDRAEANHYLARAVQAKPASAEARMYWASSLMDLGHYSQAEREFERAVQLEPSHYDTNHNLGEFYIGQGKLSAAIPFLRRAQQAHPSSVANGHDLALAEIKTGQLDQARTTLKRLLAIYPSPDLLSLLATVDEKTGRDVRAVSEYQVAAQRNPTEANMFAWGSDLLLHHALGPAEKVFEQGARQYPRSQRLQIGLGLGHYSLRRYREAAEAFSQAIKLNPNDPRPYKMLSMIYDISPPEDADVTAKLARFAQLHPHNPSALYYYALCLWKNSRTHRDPNESEQAEKLFRTTTVIDPTFADAHLHLGIIYWQRNQIEEAIEQYRQAIKSRPGLVEAHYRLAAALVRVGERAQAEREFEISARLHQIETKEKQEKRSAIMSFDSILASPATASR
jgi:tetratricopeptide (TPR) repeat protein